jgi:hypothetical protein
MFKDEKNQEIDDLITIFISLLLIGMIIGGMIARQMTIKQFKELKEAKVLHDKHIYREHGEIYRDCLRTTERSLSPWNGEIQTHQVELFNILVDSCFEQSLYGNEYDKSETD